MVASAAFKRWSSGSVGRNPQGTGGFISVEFLVATALSFVVLLFLTNFIVIQYGRGVVRAAADDAARAGSRVQADASALEACRTRAESTLEGVANMTNSRSSSCAIVPGVAGERVEATIDASFSAWLPVIPVIEEHAVASAVREKAPGAP